VLVELGVAGQRYRAVLEVLDEGASVTDVARRYGVARQTVHAWLRRYASEGGLAGLAGRSSRPETCPHQMLAVVEARVLALRRAHPGWGPSRIVWQLERDGVEPLPGRSSVYRALVRYGLIAPKQRRRRREDYRRWERGRAMELWQMDVMGRVHLADGLEVKVVTGIDDHSRFIMSAAVVARATARPVCQAPAGALGRYGIPEQILTDNGKVFTARFGRGPGPVMFDRICTGNGIRHLLTAPYSPTTTGKVERLHKTMRREFFTPRDRMFATIPQLQTALDAWVIKRRRPAAPGLRPPPAGGAVPAGRPVPGRRHERGSTASAGPAVRRGGQAAGGSVAVGERGREDLPGRVHLRCRRHLRRGAGRSGGGRRPGGHPARRGSGRHPRPAAPGRLGRPGAPDAGLPARQGRHRRADRHPAGQQHRCHHLRRNHLSGRAPLGERLDRGDHRGRVGAAVQGRQGHPHPPDPP
jgi:transposase InsO family protein